MNITFEHLLWAGVICCYTPRGGWTQRHLHWSFRCHTNICGSCI